MKKIYIPGIIFLLLIAAGVWFFHQKKHLFYPEVTFSIVHIRQMEAADADMRIQVKLKNQMPFSLSFDHFDFQIQANERILLETVGKVPVHMKGLAVSHFEVPVKIHLQDIKQVAKQDENDSTKYTFKARFIGSSARLLPDTLEVNTSEVLPTYKLPRVQMTSLEKDRLLVKDGPVFFIHLLVENRNQFPLEIKNPTYAVLLQQNEVLFDGKYPGEMLVVEPSASKAVKLRVRFDKDVLLKHSGKLLFNKNDLDLQIRFHGRLLTRNPYIDGCDLTVLIRGSLKEFLNKNN